MLLSVRFVAQRLLALHRQQALQTPKPILHRRQATLARPSQSAYWFAALFLFLVAMAASILGRGMSDQLGSNPISSLISLGTLLPNLSVGIRRLHDTGRSGTYLLWALLPIVGWIMIIVALAAKSESADNQYGPRP